MGPRTPKHTCVQMSFAGHSPSWELGRAAGTQTTSEHPQSRDSAPLPGYIDPYRWDPEGFTRVNKTLVNAEPRGSALTPRPGDPGHGNYRCKSPGAASPPPRMDPGKGGAWHPRWRLAPSPAPSTHRTAAGLGMEAVEVNGPGERHPRALPRAAGSGPEWPRSTLPALLRL